MDLFWRDEKGGALVLVAINMVVLLGFVALVIDLGLLAAARHKLLNAVDAAALAGVRELPFNPDRARIVAAEYASLNGAESIETEVSPDNTSLTVKARKELSYFLAPVLGFHRGEAKAQAIARIGGIKAVKKAAPLAVPWQDYQLGVKYTLKQAAGQESPLGPGNYSALSLGGTGASQYEDNLKYGYPGWLKVGDEVPTETGNMSHPTRRAIEYRLALCQHSPPCTPQHFEPDCPRILIVPLYNPSTLEGHQISSITIIGFAAFLVEQVRGEGNENYIEGYFIRTIVAGEADPQQPDYGLEGIKLVK
ncbi:Putative Flp pilus-assembly TadE/G-like [Thermanaeromonas toyohensis ToBE]|uniref:Putative Flp pilus-assembly TadE/G-like n=1 Tax=Thermanaeromonas toyohensis ToBE TaxID=698762 RepID=A0A1W1VNE5_9FIRM|nr:TadE/TadG family type IV pilus assembly protein [Thermanaeromonas toyohensis]SMB94889.1 Putative Flp pilus-assembly TadE/G-like [Thermanaeromonas toyohensis ToBE]